MKIKGVLFDKDDTLIDLAAFWEPPIARATKMIAARFGRAGDDALIQALQRAAGIDRGALIPESLVVAGTNLAIAKAWADTLNAQGLFAGEGDVLDFLRMLDDAALRYGLVRGTTDVKMMLSALKEQGMALGVVTSDDLAPTKHCLKRLGVLGLLDMILTADTVPHAKPAPDAADMFRARFSLLPEETAMVGDSENDMLFAKNAGLVGLYYAKETRQLPPGARFLLRDMALLPALTRRLNGAS